MFHVSSVPFQPLFSEFILTHISEYFCQTGLKKILASQLIEIVDMRHIVTARIKLSLFPLFRIHYVAATGNNTPSRSYTIIT